MKTRNKIILVITTVITLIMSMITTASAAQVSSLINQATYIDSSNVNQIDILMGSNDTFAPISNKMVTIRPQTNFYLSETATGNYTKYTPISVQTSSTQHPITWYGVMQNSDYGTGESDGLTTKMFDVSRRYFMYSQYETPNPKKIQSVIFKTGEIYGFFPKDSTPSTNLPFYTLNIKVDNEYAIVAMHVRTTINYEVLNEEEKAYITKTYSTSRVEYIQGTGSIQEMRIEPNYDKIYSYETENFYQLKITSMETEVSFTPADIEYIGETYLDSIEIESRYATRNFEEHYYERDLPGLEAETIIKEVIVSPEVDFTTWIVKAVGGFMDMEIYPGLSVGAIFATVGGIALLMMVLKMIAGG